MRFPVVLILFAVVNVVHVSSVQQHIHSNYVYDVQKVNKVDRVGLATDNNNIVEFLPRRAEYLILDALDRFPAARRKREAPLGIAVRVGVAVAKGLKKAYDAYKGAKKARNAAKAATQGKKAIDKVLKGTKPSGSNKRKTTFEHKAQNVKDPFKDANKRFDSVKPKDVKSLSGDKVKGRTGKVGDHTITVRDKSTSGEKSPTVEIFKTDQKRRITHKVRHEKPVETPKTSGGKKSGGSWWGGGSTKKSSVLRNQITTTQAPSTPPTQGLCDGCLIANGVGYNPYPGDCTKYVQCWVDGETVRALVRSCPFGQYWDADAITCRPSFLVKCPADPCKNALPGFTYGMPEYGCRGFWKCIDRFSVGHCCSEDSAYVEGMGCLEDVPCFGSCPPEGGIAVKQFCDKRPHWDSRFYTVIISDRGNVVRRCPVGTVYQQESCDCQQRVSDVDLCSKSYPCHNSGTCVNVPGSYICICSAQWTGNKCQLDVNECLLSPCLLGRTCLNTRGSYICRCVAGRTGANCEIVSDGKGVRGFNHL